MPNLKSFSDFDLSEDFPSDVELLHFHRLISRPRTIKNLWKEFRENSNSKNGKIAKDTFIRVFTQLLEQNNQRLAKAFFRRFASRLYSDKGQVEKVSDMIDLHDIVIVLTILAKLSDETKLRLVFELTDVDEDGCLSPDEIGRMFEVIERVLNRENSDIKIKSKVLLDQISKDRARRKYDWAMKTVGNLEDKCKKEEGLVTFQEFSDALSKVPNLLNSFLPRYTNLKDVLASPQAEKEYFVSNLYRDDFVMFRYEMHSLMTSNMNIEQKRLRKNKAEFSSNDRSDVLKAAGIGIASTSHIRSKIIKGSELQRKEVPGIIKTSDISHLETGLPSQVWEFNNLPNKTYVRKEGRRTNSIELDLKSRREARRLMVPKSKAFAAIEEIETEMKGQGFKNDKVDEVSLVDTGSIVRRETDRLKGIPRYPVEKWSGH